jgi:[acyl-carrier-protein] S-malonyltransferase
MGRDLFEAFAEAREIFEQANELLEFDLLSLMFGRADEPVSEERERALRQTDVAQPALFVHSLASWTLLKQSGRSPDMVAGHSLGEYSALAAAGAVSFEDGLAIASLRGRLMARAGERKPGTMAALLGLDADQVERVCREAEETTGMIVRGANFNAPGQIVISGDIAAVEAAMELAKESGARRVVGLPVSGAFHSPLMAEALAGLSEALGHLEISSPDCPVYLNATGEATMDPEEIRARLAEQLLSPVRWTDILLAMRDAGATDYVEVGPGKILSGLVRRTLGREVAVGLAGSASDFGSP